MGEKTVCEIVLYKLDYATGYAVPHFLFPLYGLYVDYSEERLGGKKSGEKKNSIISLCLTWFFVRLRLLSLNFLY